MVHNSLASVLGKLVVFGAARPPSLARWSPASWYDGCVLFLKSFALFMPILTQINAPFGRFALSKSIFNMPGNVTFMLMEAFGPIVFLLAFASAPLSSSPSPSLLESLPLSPSLEHLKTIPTANCVLASLYVIHYINRAFLQPLRGPPRSPSHLSVFLSAAIFQSANGFVMGTWLGGSSPPLQLPKEIVDPSSALSKVVSSLAKRTITRPGLVDDGMQTLLSPFFLLGIAGWLVGLAGNIYHDEILFDIRRKAQREKKNSDKSRNGPEDSKPKYDVPHGGLYSLISYPNYLCEWFEWFSFAVAALSFTRLSPLSAHAAPLTLAGRALLLVSSPPLLFPIVEVIVMLPRALNGHEWYKSKFGIEGDGKGGRYPQTRKAILPYLL